MNWDILIEILWVAFILICFSLPAVTMLGLLKKLGGPDRKKNGILYYFLGLGAGLLVFYPAKDIAYKLSEFASSVFIPRDESPLLFLALPLIILVSASVYALTLLVLLGMGSFLAQYLYFRFSNKESIP